ncbi:phosphoheptose isomerase [Parasulfuritortus cantonensis]|uniref:Phosphoheptose isomerase n=1 Tax=Parasulfuritortus cantonensis TaxID=2528202 RepID=A0A4R1BFX9_9PROT|nr:phosphoheptose isomerase [Parasulfuritortus cantonensis]TCJ16079.1 phosphoheptose isomerase [Parasulfuritortus cantonensis]
MDLTEHIQQTFADSAQTVLESAEALAGPIALAAEHMVGALLGDGKILACGNGGSATDAHLFASTMINRFERERPGLAAISLTSATATLTSIANDYDYGLVFARQVAALGGPGDILLAISTSGYSRNVLEAVRAGHEKEMSVVALTGRDGGDLAEILHEEDVLVCVPAETTARIREIHLLAIHCLCDTIDNLLLGI